MGSSLSARSSALFFNDAKCTGYMGGSMAALRRVEWGEVPGAANSADEERDLALSFQRGEADAYPCIYNRYHWSVYNVCYRMLDNRDDAQEATQDTFLKVYQALGRFNGSYRLGPWIIRIATNVSHDHLRLRKRRPQDSVSIDALHQEPRACTDDPEQILVERAEGVEVRKVLSSLPPTHRAAIVLRDVEGLTYSEIALRLGMSESQVKALLHRARKRFKRTWVPAPVLFPGHLLDRLRDRLLSSRVPDGPMAATSSVGNLATATSSVTSSGVLEQFAGIAAERIAPVVVAAVMGAATVAATVGWMETGSDRDRPGRSTAPVAENEGISGPGRAQVGAPPGAASGKAVAPGDEGLANKSKRGDENAAGGGKPDREEAETAGSIDGKDNEESNDDKEKVSGADPSGATGSIPSDGQGLERDQDSPSTECSDGQDNDGDGSVDLADAGCSNLDGTAENSDATPATPPTPPTECSDGQDNDGDGSVDLNDAGCAGPEGTAEDSKPEASPTSSPE